MKKTQKLTVSLTKAEIIRKIQDLAAKVTVWEVTETNETNGSMHIKSSADGSSWGEKIEISITERDGQSEVNITSKPAVRTTLFDYGKNQRNIDAIRQSLTDGTVDEQVVVRNYLTARGKWNTIFFVVAGVALVLFVLSRVI